MHVLIIPSEHFVTPRYPLGGIFQLHQSNALHNAGYQVGVIAPGIITARFFLRKYTYPFFENVNGYPVLRRYVRKIYPQRWESPANSIPFCKNLGLDLYLEYKKRFGTPDLIHAHNMQFAGFIAQAIHESHKVPFIITEHSGNFRTNSMSPKWFLPLKEAISAGSVMTVVSRALATSIENQLGVVGIDVLPNIVDSSFVSSELVHRRSNASGFIFLNIASLDTRKNQAAIIEAFSIHFKGKRAKLRIGGDGPLKKYLEHEVKRLGLKEQVVFLGYLDRQSVMREMQDADCFVLSSQEETFGVVLIESLACGTPIIATRCGGPDEIVNNKNGLLVLPGDPVALGEAMVRMAETSGQYLPESLREECIARFGEKAFITNVGRYYKKAVGLA